MVRLNGEIYDNKKEHTYFSYILNKNKNSELKLTFIDSGLFLKNTEISDKFISGNGELVFLLDNQSNQVTGESIILKILVSKMHHFLQGFYNWLPLQGY